MKLSREQRIEQAAKHGIVEGATVQCASKDGTEAIIPDPRVWNIEEHSGEDRFTIRILAGKGILLIHSAANESWATVVKPAPPTLLIPASPRRDELAEKIVIAMAGHGTFSDAKFLVDKAYKVADALLSKQGK